MMKFIVVLVAVGLSFACSKDNQQEDLSLSNDVLESRKSGNKITICHINGSGEYRPMSVNKNALPGHLSHGDYVPDADGDGYTAVGACTGSKDDCDDQDEDVNPENTFCTDCVCFNLDSVNNSALSLFYNSEDNPCGIYDEGVGVLIFYFVGADTIVVAAGIDEDGRHLVGRSRVVNGVVIHPENGDCLKYVESGDITLAQYESCLAGLRTIITTHPEMDNVCDSDHPPVLEDTNPLDQEKVLKK